MPVNARCPHVVFRDVFGPGVVAALVDYAVEREPDFVAARAYDRRSSQAAVDRGRRDCMLLAGLGPFQARMESFVRSIVAPVLSELRLNEPGGVPKAGKKTGRP